ncbi:MAG: phosphoribosyl-AMP cyclohydrolase [Nanoarchaeota archaeon]
MIEPEFKKGLIPVITQDYKTKVVLMTAYMDKAAWRKTLETNRVWYYSRSRNKLWMKGEESGNVQEVKEILLDCDNDTVLIKINQIGGAACHTGYQTCFYRNIKGEVISKKVFDPKTVYKK